MSRTLKKLTFQENNLHLDNLYIESDLGADDLRGAIVAIQNESMGEAFIWKYNDQSTSDYPEFYISSSSSPDTSKAYLISRYTGDGSNDHLSDTPFILCDWSWDSNLSQWSRLSRPIGFKCEREFYPISNTYASKWVGYEVTENMTTGVISWGQETGYVFYIYQDAYPIVTNIFDTQVESATCDGQGANIVNDYCTELSTLARTCDASNINNPLTIYRYKITAGRVIGQSGGSDVYANFVWYDYSSKSNLAGTYNQSTITSDAESLLIKCSRLRVATFSGQSYNQFEVGAIDWTSTMILCDYVNYLEDNEWYIGYYPAGGGQSGNETITYVNITLDSTVITY